MYQSFYRSGILETEPTQSRKVGGMCIGRRTTTQFFHFKWIDMTN